MDAPDQSSWVGFDLGGSKMLAAAFDGRLQVVGRKRRKSEGFLGSESGIDRIAETINDALADAKIPKNSLRGIGMACPGPVEMDRGVLIHAPNLGWRDIPLAELLQKKFNCPVFLLNDVDAGVYGEYRFGAAVGSNCVVGVFPGTGVGGGCVYRGQVLHGATMSAMEIGHIRVVPDGPLCGCGQHGCLEAVASRLAITGAVAQAAYRGQAPLVMSLAGTDLSAMRSGQLAQAINAGERVVERIVRDAAAHIGRAVATIVPLLGPDTVVLGGGLVEALPDLFVAEVTGAAQANVMPSFAGTFRVLAAKLTDDATAIGAAAWAQQSIASATK